MSLQVRRGEIVCLAGIDGNGQTEFVYGLTGLEPLTSGKISLCGHDITHAPIRKRSLLGMSHIPEDRHKHGLVLDYTLEDNLVLQRYFEPEFTDKAGFLRRDNIRKYAQRLIDQYDVRSGQGPVTVARSMSGGNQQKAIVAREIDKDPELLVAVQPTRGLDVGAIEYIHSQLVAERDKGKAVLLVSLELDEVMDVPVYRLRLRAVLLGGVFAGMAGAVMCLSSANVFVNDMSAGTGFMAFAANQFGQWSPVGGYLATLLFGVMSALRMRLQSFGVATQLTQMLPYLAALIGIKLTGMRMRAPAANGASYPHPLSAPRVRRKAAAAASTKGPKA